MKRLSILVALLITLISPVHADIFISGAVAKDIGHSYGFYLGQKESLKKISVLFPDLSGSAELSEKEFLLAFGGSIDEMDKSMLTVQNIDWQAIKSDISHRLAAESARRKWTRSEAAQFIQLVRDRAKGEIPSPAIETFLMFEPGYQKNPASEFAEGYKQKYHHDGSGKAKGVGFSIAVPRSWKELEAYRPNVVTKFGSENGRGDDYFMVLIHDLDMEEGEEISAADVSEILNPDDMADMLPKNARYIDSGAMALESLPGYWVRYSLEETRVRTTVHGGAILYVVFYKNKMIQLFASVMGSENERENLDVRFTKFEPLFDQIANSLVLPQLYK